MLTLRTTSQFRRDEKLARKRGLDMSLIEWTIQTLLEEKPLPQSFCDHALVGNYAGYRECHMLPDWLLIYYVEHDNMVLVAARTGTHADLSL
ncbi:addiction module toxin, RelE/StbE family [Clostridia bacterium]|nr:addiction module toxin, RelE/StbE family [Clostridia bacterium]